MATLASTAVFGHFFCALNKIDHENLWLGYLQTYKTTSVIIISNYEVKAMWIGKNQLINHQPTGSNPNFDL
jgi:hypothetical protein